MPLIDGVGDEVTYFFLALLSFVVAVIAWWTTSISEQRLLRTVFLIDRQARADNRVQNIPAHLLSEGVSTMSEPPSPATQQEVEVEGASTAQTSLGKPPDEPAGSSVDAGQTAAAGTSPEEQEQSSILQAMDAAETNVLRQRRTAFYSRHDTLIGHFGEGEPAAPSNFDGNDADDEDFPYEGIPDAESGDFVLTEHNYSTPPAPSTSNSNDAGIKIKLKYINDDLKLVDCRLEETVGEFKRRNFSVELNSNKIVRLIFNGRVLQPDEALLQTCGLFENCVVHCLIHNKRPSVIDSGGATANADDFMRRNNNNRQRMPPMNNNNQGRESDLGNILFALISFILGSAWYFRYVYAHLYTITATVALLAVTGIFSVVVIGMYFPDQQEATAAAGVPQQQRTENEER